MAILAVETSVFTEMTQVEPDTFFLILLPVKAYDLKKHYTRL